MDPIKQAFDKIKSEIQSLKDAVNILSEELEVQRTQIQQIKRTQTHHLKDQTIRHINQTRNQPLETPKPPNSPISIGNEGVQTDRQTNRQTDNHPPISTERQIPCVSLSQNIIKNQENQQNFNQTQEIPQNFSKIDHLEQVSNILDSLDDIKKDLRHKFKGLTNKEMQVFEAIYSLENQGLIIDYPLLSQHLSLSESSIRDYTKNIIKKGIPLMKLKENNKKITLKIAPNLRQIASLNTIQSLRNL